MVSQKNNGPKDLVSSENDKEPLQKAAQAASGEKNSGKGEIAELRSEVDRVSDDLKVAVTDFNMTTCNLTIVNVGSKTIFFQSQNGFEWNTIFLSYANDSAWRSYVIEQYNLLEIKVSAANCTFTPDHHGFINPEEEALVSFAVPTDAPEIPQQGVVSVAFATHYGFTAKTEAVRQE